MFEVQVDVSSVTTFDSAQLLFKGLTLPMFSGRCIFTLSPLLKRDRLTCERHSSIPMASLTTTIPHSDLATRVCHACFYLVGAQGLPSEVGMLGLTVCLVLPFIALLHHFIIAPMAFGPLSHVPGPMLCKLSRYYLSYFNVSLQRTNKIHEWHTKYGPVICVGPEEISLATPSLMREIYGISGRYAKSEYFDYFVTHGERALFATRQYTAHREKRKRIASFYHNVKQPWIEGFINERVDAIISQIDGKFNDISLDVFQSMSHFAFDNISRLLYGKRHCTHTTEIDGEERWILAALRKAQLWGPFQADFPRLYGLVRRLLSLLGFHPTSLHADDDLCRWNDDTITDIIAERRATKGEEDTLLHRLLNERNPDGTPLSLAYIAAELYDNLNAAQMTVAITLTYIIYHISENPEWQTKIHDEIVGLPREVSGVPSFASIDSAPVLDACIREVYRINPGTGGHAERVVPDGGKVYDGIHIPGGVRLPLISGCQIEQLTMPLDPRDSLDHCSAPEHHLILISQRVPSGPLARANLRASAYARRKSYSLRLRSAALCR